MANELACTVFAVQEKRADSKESTLIKTTLH